MEEKFKGLTKEDAIIIARVWRGSTSCVLNSVSEATDFINAELISCMENKFTAPDLDAEYRITFELMTKEEFESLSEFGGY